MTTLADRIADFETQANQLLDLPQQIADTAQQRINQIGAYYQQRLQELHLSAYVHQQLGDDNADGSESAPLKAIDEALRRTPPGGLCRVLLAGDYRMDSMVAVERRNLLVLPASGAAPTLSYTPRTINISNTEYRGTYGFDLRFDAGVMFGGLNIVAPSMTPPYDQLPLHPQTGGLVQSTNSQYFWSQYVQIRYCIIDLPQTPLAPLISATKGGLALAMHSVTLDGAPLQGRLLFGVTDPAGTDPTTIPWLVTNLTTV